MLTKLSVRNYALIKELDIDLESGLTIITGETGAGKSILLGALSLILGTRADTSALLDKNEKCIVEGIFNLSAYELQDFFKSNDLDYDDKTLVRREVNPAGKSRAFINDTPVTVSVLKDLGDRLIDIHSQHQTLMLNDNSFQLSVVDSFAGTKMLLKKYSGSYNTYRKLKKEYSGLKQSYDKNKADLEYYRHQLLQIEEAKLKKGEQEELEAGQELLVHSEEIKNALTSSAQLFLSDEISILRMLREVRSNLARIRNFLPQSEALSSRIESALIELDDFAAEIDRLASTIDADPARLAQINERLDVIYTLCHKHRAENLDELLVKTEEMKSQLTALASGDDRIAELEKLIEVEEKNLRKLSEELSAKRRNILPETESKITELLKQLGMPNARFRIDFSSDGEYRPSGTDNAEFLFSSNKQIAPENISRIASGGELSRVMLSLKSVLSRNSNLPTIIFDEIDSGVSGEVADKVGQILESMGKYMQVINITHLPQVASRGGRHYHVYKDDNDDATITRIRLLTDEERVLEVARLLSGSEVTETALKNARELLKTVIN
ncbi:MAG TPA: DNA repair protein RecN [Bacteroidales bacterium]|nr:DNA repair protein RecN [Bacteroidales bacterium]